MLSVEYFEEGRISVARQGIDPVLANDFQEEWLGVLPVSEHGYFNVFFPVNIDHGIDHFNNMGIELPATKKVLELVHPFLRRAPSLTINHQGAGAAQPLHVDKKFLDDSALIVHGGDNGAFDYYSNTERDYRTIELGAGDILHQRMPGVLHRGRNTGNQTRITATVHTNLE